MNTELVINNDMNKTSSLEETKALAAAISPRDQALIDILAILTLFPKPTVREILDIILGSYNLQKTRLKIAYKPKFQVADKILNDPALQEQFLKDYQSFLDGDIAFMPDEYGSEGNISKIKYGLRAKGILDDNNLII